MTLATPPLGAAFDKMFRGLLGSLAGASLGGLLSGWLDARLASAASGASGLVLACAGLAAPLALPLGLAVWLLRVLFLGGEAWSLAKLWRALGAQRGEARATWVVTPPLVAVAGLFGLLALAGVSARLFGAEAQGAAALALTPLSVIPLILAALAAVRLLVSALARRVDVQRVSPQASLVASVLIFGVGLALLVLWGETGGGGGPLKILGVLRRQELDLRAPGLLLVIALAALVLPSPPQRPLGFGLAVLVTLAPLGLTWQAARGATLDEAAALAIERQAPLGRSALTLLRKLSDRDHDGVSAAFAGGDCNDHDPSVSPRAIDVAGNGKDEDCQGGDAKPPAQLSPAEAAAAASARDALPNDLNVVFITIDTLRADLGFLGNPRNVSPNLDALAKQSVVFERAYSLASYTGKSMGPLMIGKYSSEVDGGFSHFNKYSRRETFVQERLHAAGVRTLSVQGYWYFFKDAGFERGFDVIDSSAAPKVASIEGDQSSNSDEQCDAAVKLLAAPELATQRFFMWMHFVDPHAEYAPHPEHDFGPKPRDRYDGEVAFVDEHLGRVLAALDHSSFAGRTAVVVTSDHGEAFNEHGMIRHGFELWEELVRVPLLFKVPGVVPRHVSARRSAIDVVPTLLDLFKVPFAAHAATDFISGESLLPDLRRAAGTPDPDKPVFIDMARGPYNAERQALIEKDQKLTVSEGRVLGLYDLAQDPGEKQDLSRDKARVTAARDAYTAFKSRLRPVPMPQP